VVKSWCEPRRASRSELHNVGCDCAVAGEAACIATCSLSRHSVSDWSCSAVAILRRAGRPRWRIRFADHQEGRLLKAEHFLVLGADHQDLATQTWRAADTGSMTGL